MSKKQSFCFGTVLLLLMGAITAVYAVMCVSRKDVTPPQITITEPELCVSVNYTQEDLLEGITAQDDRDGDVTAGVVIEQIGNITPQHTANVVYAAFDHAGNVSKATRNLVFKDYTPPRFGQKRALVMPEGINQDVLRIMTAQDVVDGDISSKVKGNLVSNTISLSYTGTHQVEFRVTNSMGDTSKITLPVDVCAAGTYNADLILKDYLIYVHKGAEFHPEKYLDSLMVGSMKYAMDGSNADIQVVFDKTETRSGHHTISVDMNSQVNLDVPGVYSVTYVVTMDNRYTGFSRLNVVVEE